MKPFACPQITSDFGQLISNGCEMTEQGNVIHAPSIFITAGNLQ